jgi:hypothetical protein
VEFHVGPQGLGCFLTPFNAHVEQVKVPASTCCESTSNGKAHTTSCEAIRESSWTLGKEEPPLLVIGATLAILAPLDVHSSSSSDVQAILIKSVSTTEHLGQLMNCISVDTSDCKNCCCCCVIRWQETWGYRPELLSRRLHELQFTLFSTFETLSQRLIYTRGSIILRLRLFLHRSHVSEPRT